MTTALPPRGGSLGERWNGYWFRPAPLFDLAVCRLLAVGSQLAYLLLFDVLGRLGAHAAMPVERYEPLAIVRLLTLPIGSGAPPSFELLAVVFWITCGAGLLALVGLRTNASLAVFAVGYLFLQGYLYSWGEFHHSEALMAVTLLVFAMAPCGRVLSRDGRLARRREEREPGSASPPQAGDGLSPIAGWPLLLVGWMFALVYGSAALAKLGSGLEWANGYTLQYYFLLIGGMTESPVGVWLGHQHALAVVLSWLTLLFEATFFLVLVDRRLAWIYLPAGIGFHVGIYLTMGFFFWHYVVLYSVFVPWSALRRRPR